MHRFTLGGYLLQKTKERMLLITSKQKDIYKCKGKSGCTGYTCLWKVQHRFQEVTLKICSKRLLPQFRVKEFQQKASLKVAQVQCRPDSAWENPPVGMGPVCQTSLSTGLSKWELDPRHTERSPIFPPLFLVRTTIDLTKIATCWSLT